VCPLGIKSILLSNSTSPLPNHNNIRKLPPTLGNCTQLKLLNLSHNIIQSLPKNIYNLKREINLSNNQIETLPQLPISKFGKEVTHLDLSINELYTKAVSFWINNNSNDNANTNVNETFHLGQRCFTLLCERFFISIVITFVFLASFFFSFSKIEQKKNFPQKN
jgi:Leucine-rich repeat (LRR) protein